MLPPVSKEDFAVILANALCKNGVEQKSLHFDQKDFALRLKDGRGQILSSLHLSNLYNGFSQATTEKERDNVVRRALAVWSQSDETRSYEEVKPFLRPIIREKRHYPIASDDPSQLAYPQSPISYQYTLLIAIDNTDFITPLSEFDFEKFGVSFEVALEDAYDNLNKIPLEWAIHESSESPADCCYVYESEHEYASSIIVFPEAILELPVLGRHIVFTPAKNVTIVTGSECMYGLQTALEFIDECEYRQNALMPEFLCLNENGDGYVSSELSRDHPMFEPFHKIRLLEEAGIHVEYAKQYESKFDQLYKQSNRLADYTVYDIDGRFESQTEFAADEHNVIFPQVERILITSDEGDISLFWDDFGEVAQDNCPQISEYPLLFQLQKPLTKSQIDDLRQLHSDD